MDTDDSDYSGIVPDDLPPAIPVETSLSEYEIQQRLKKEKNKLMKKLAKYGITMEEWDALEKYKGDKYFLIATMLHKIDLFQYNLPRYGEVFNNPDFLKPNKIIDSYCKMYAAMCKYGKRKNRNLKIYRIDSRLFTEEMKKTRRTESVLSFSPDEYNWTFAQGKNNVLLLKGVIKKGTPCIDYSELNDDQEHEVLIPPFLDIDFSEGKTNDDGYTEYDIHISKNKKIDLTEEKKRKMEDLKDTILKSDIPSRYYSNWYRIIRTCPNAKGDDTESVKLKEEFFEWQDTLKEYLQLRFIEIENEIENPSLCIGDLLSWIIGRARDKKGNFVETVKRIIEDGITTKEEEREE